MAEPTADTVLATGASLPAEPRPIALDIPGYRIAAVLGEGGMGTVYAAEQQSPRRPVAIKVLHARSDSALARFRTEADIMARLDHPGIARVLEAGDADGRPFLVMELVDGAMLDAYAGGLPRARRLALFAKLCDAVHHAHVKGVIHRDLKPANVMVRPGDRVVVLDFGVARLEADGATSETRAGELIGTPLYMSPEQAMLRADEVDARSDVYTLGVMLYELLCGELPYDARGLPLAAVSGAIRDQEAIPLSRRDASLRGDLEAIAAKSLRKEPTERYQSAAALGDDVRRVLGGLPVSVRMPGTVEQLRRFVRRRPLIASAIGLGALATAVFAVVVTYFWLEARSARETAETAQHRAEVARAELEVRTNELTLRQARAALGRDPTEAIAWLSTLVGATRAESGAAASGPVGATRAEAGEAASGTVVATRAETDVALARAAWGVADEALGRGVASLVVRAHQDEVHWVESLGGADFVTGGYDGRVIVWAAPAFAPRVVFQTGHGRVHLVRPSPDGGRLAIGSDDGTLTVTARDGKVIANLEGHVGDVQHVAWSADGAYLASGDDHGNVWLWPRGAAPGRRLIGSKVAVGTLAFSQDGATLVGGDHAGSLWVWQVASGALATVQIGVDVGDAWTDGQRVVAVDATGTVRTWRIGPAPERTDTTGMPSKGAAPDRTDTTGMPSKGAAPDRTGMPSKSAVPAPDRAGVPSKGAAPDRTGMPSKGAVPALDRTGMPSKGAVPALDRTDTTGMPSKGAAPDRTGMPSKGAVPALDRTGMPSKGAALDRADVPSKGAAPDRTGMPINGAVPAPDRAGVPSNGAVPALDRAGVPSKSAALASTGVSREGAMLTLERTVATGMPTKRAVFADDGAWVVLAGISGVAMRVEGEQVETVATHRAQVRAIAITPDGGRIATASDDGLLQVLDRATGARRVLRGHAARIRHLAFAGGALLSSDGEGVVRRWVLDAMPATVLDGTAPIDRLAASPDGARLASVDATGEVVLWSLADRGRARVGKVDGHASAIAIAGPVVVTGSAEGVVTWWSATPLRRTMAGIIQAIAVSGERVAVSTSIGPIGVFTLDGEPVVTLPGNVGGTDIVAFDRRGAWLASGGQDRVIRLYDATQGFAPRAAWVGPKGDTHFLAFSPAGDRVIAAGNDGVVFGWAMTGALETAAATTLGKHVGAVSGLAVSPDGRWLASAGRDDVVVRHALDGSGEDRIATGGAGSALAFDAAGGLLAVTRTGTVVYAAPGALATVIDHGARRGAAVAPDRLAVALDDGTIVIVGASARSMDQLVDVLAHATTYRLAP